MLKATLVMRQELFFFDPSLSFTELWSRMKPWMVAQGYMKTIRRKYKPRAKKPAKSSNILHSGSTDF